MSAPLRRRKESSWPKTSTYRSLRSRCASETNLSDLVVKGQGDSLNRRPRTAGDAYRAARNHYFCIEPANKFVEMKIEAKKRATHEDRILNPIKMIDNDPPRLVPRIPRVERAAYRLDDLMLQNKRLLERICTIWRTKGVVDSSPPIVQRKSTYRKRIWDFVRIEADNVALLYFIQTAAPQVPTRDDCAKFHKRSMDTIKLISKHPEMYMKDTSLDLPLPMADPPTVDPEAPPRKRVFMEFITSQERFLGRVEMELFEEQAPQTVANFLAHIRGEAPRKDEGGAGAEAGGDKVGDEEPKTYSYRDTPLHRILPGYYCLGGDVVQKNGSGGNSIHGEAFPDEPNDLTHNEAGLLCTIGSKPDSNDSKFMITMKPLPTLDGTSTVFGRVLKGFEVLWAINALGAKASGKPVVQVYCCNCGELERPQKKQQRRAAVKGGGNKDKTVLKAQRRRTYSSTRMSFSSGRVSFPSTSPYGSMARQRI